MEPTGTASLGGGVQLAPARASAAAPSGFLNGPLLDAATLIFSPLLALGVGFLVARVPAQSWSARFFSNPINLLVVLGATVTHSHLVLVFFRSHGNRKIFAQHRWRFTLVPVACFAAMVLSKWLLLFGAAVTAIWDVYHSSLQVFGIGRIYDAKAGVDPRHGRGLDILVAHVLYIGPVLAGVNLMTHVNSFKRINDVGSTLFDFVPAYASRFHWRITEAVICASLLVLGYYVLWQVRAARRGVPPSWQKVAMLVSTGICTVCAWGFNSFGQAFLIVNLFHAVQYYAIVWWAEGSNIQRLFRLRDVPKGGLAAWGILMALILSYGFWVAATYDAWAPSPRAAEWVMALVNTVALMHFWYDGFIWSVRKKEVPA